MSKAIKAIKAMTADDLAELRLLLATAPPAVVVPPVVANLAIAPEIRSALVDSFVGSLDDVSRNEGFRTAVLKFGESIPAEYRGKPLPKADAEAMADSASSRFLSSYGDLTAKPEETRKAIARMVAQKKSRALALFTCAPILPSIYAQGFSGTIQETLKVCTKLKDASYDVPKVMALLKSDAEKPKDYGAYIAQTVAGILNVKAENLGAASAKAKAQLVAWADEWGIKPKHADEHRNPALARS